MRTINGVMSGAWVAIGVLYLTEVIEPSVLLSTIMAFVIAISSLPDLIE